MKTSRHGCRSVRVTAVLAMAPVGVSLAESAPAKVEASIPFGLIRDWQPDRERGMWVQAYSRKWYYAEFMGRCNGLSFATAVGFDTRYQSSFDRWSSVFVPGYGRCPIQTFSPSDAPPRRKRKGSQELEVAAAAACSAPAAAASEPACQQGFTAPHELIGAITPNRQEDHRDRRTGTPGPPRGHSGDRRHHLQRKSEHYKDAAESVQKIARTACGGIFVTMNGTPGHAAHVYSVSLRSATGG